MEVNILGVIGPVLKCEWLLKDWQIAIYSSVRFFFQMFDNSKRKPQLPFWQKNYEIRKWELHYFVIYFVRNEAESDGIDIYSIFHHSVDIT